jgi:hypothetical protein
MNNTAPPLTRAARIPQTPVRRLPRSRISDFRRRHGVHFENLFVQVLKLCVKAGLVKLGHVALDGTKLKANASKHKAISYERMQKEEQKLRQICFDGAEGSAAEWALICATLNLLKLFHAAAA